MIAAILNAFEIGDQQYTINPFGSGLINNTWLVSHGATAYILQRINQNVFTEPQKIADNIESISAFLKVNAPGYLFVEPLKTKAGGTLHDQSGEGYFRLFPFVKDSHTVDVVDSPGQAYEAAAQFGRFTNNLRLFHAQSLHITLKDFHNLGLRYQQFLQSLQDPPAERMQKAGDLVFFLQQQYPILEEYLHICNLPDFKQRVTHHDTKISNVLFNDDNKGLCVIDLDTVMPGYFISDVGDMMRTYLSPVSEEEKDFTKIEVRDDYFLAIVKGYLSEMQEELSKTEKQYFVYAGKFMIYMQALRFLADYLNNDVYYGQKYEGHNLVRASNQAVLLQKLMEKENMLQQQALMIINQNSPVSLSSL